jgi:NAD(P)-dependent dehydrogenase (short-subunit alcohol dehydrogenase family)
MAECGCTAAVLGTALNAPPLKSEGSVSRAGCVRGAESILYIRAFLKPAPALAREDLEVMFSLIDRIALVSGGARGIGRETALTLARQGASVFAADILEQELADLAARSREEKLPIRCVRLDVTSPEDWARVAEQVAEAFGRLDILVNNAGMMDSRSFFDTELEDFRRTMRVNVEGMFIGAKAMLPLLSRGGKANPAGASMINISSAYGEIAGPWNVAYCASKGAVRMFTKALAVDLAQAKTNIRVNAIQPGAIDTAMLKSSLGVFIKAGVLANVDALDKMLESMTPLGRMGQPDDIAGVVAFLASDAAKFMTGAVLNADGGLTII